MSCVFTRWRHLTIPSSTLQLAHRAAGIGGFNQRQGVSPNIFDFEVCGLGKRKIIEYIVATWCQILRLKSTKFDIGWSSAPDPARVARSAPPADPQLTPSPLSALRASKQLASPNRLLAAGHRCTTRSALAEVCSCTFLVFSSRKLSRH